MNTQRENLLRTQATAEVLRALGATAMTGDNGSGRADRQRGVILDEVNPVESVIHSETYWREQVGFDYRQVRYRVIATITVERKELPE